MKFANVRVYGAAGGQSRKGNVTAHIDVDDVDTVHEISRLIEAAPAMLDALIAALPYVETAEDDPIYKIGAVARITRQVREAIALTEPRVQNKGVDTMSTRHFQTYNGKTRTGQSVSVIVRFDTDLGEWSNNVLIDGKKHPNKTYFTGDKEDAMASAELMLRELTG